MCMFLYRALRQVLLWFGALYINWIELNCKDGCWVWWFEYRIDQRKGVFILNRDLIQAPLISIGPDGFCLFDKEKPCSQRRGGGMNNANYPPVSPGLLVNCAFSPHWTTSNKINRLTIVDANPGYNMVLSLFRCVTNLHRLNFWVWRLWHRLNRSLGCASWK